MVGRGRAQEPLQPDRPTTKRSNVLNSSRKPCPPRALPKASLTPGANLRSRPPAPLFIITPLTPRSHKGSVSPPPPLACVDTDVPEPAGKGGRKGPNPHSAAIWSPLRGAAQKSPFARGRKCWWDGGRSFMGGGAPCAPGLALEEANFPSVPQPPSERTGESGGLERDLTMASPVGRCGLHPTSPSRARRASAQPTFPLGGGLFQ